MIVRRREQQHQGDAGHGADTGRGHADCADPGKASRYDTGSSSLCDVLAQADARRAPDRRCDYPERATCYPAAQHDPLAQANDAAAHQAAHVQPQDAGGTAACGANHELAPQPADGQRQGPTDGPPDGRDHDPPAGARYPATQEQPLAQPADHSGGSASHQPGQRQGRGYLDRSACHHGATSKHLGSPRPGDGTTGDPAHRREHGPQRPHAEPLPPGAHAHSRATLNTGCRLGPHLFFPINHSRQDTIPSRPRHCSLRRNPERPGDVDSRPRGHDERQTPPST